MPKVDYIRPELVAFLPRYTLVKDCLEGSLAIKAKRTLYLPQPNEEDTSPENQKRYDAYIKRAKFYNVTKRTLSGLVGLIFTKPPVNDVPKGLEPLLKNAGGAGISLQQSQKIACEYAASYGRGGILTDYPSSESEAVSKLDLKTKNMRPNLIIIEPWNIINWRKKVIDNEIVHSLIVIKETYEKTDDGFEQEHGQQWRVLKLDELNRYVVEIWRDDYMDAPYSVSIPKDNNGTVFNRIPFEFFGSENNDSVIDLAPLYDIAELNIGHYQNSADYEEACFICGQPTLVAVGLTEEWYEKQLGGKILFGSRSGIALPTGADAKLLQAEPNIMPIEAMKHKEALMASLGARIVQEKTVQRTATESGIDNTSEMSVLSSIAVNISSAFAKSLQHAAKFTGDDPNSVNIQLNSDFEAMQLTIDDLIKLMSLTNGNMLSFTEFRNVARRMGVTSLEDAAAKAEIGKDIEAEMFRESNLGRQ